MKEIFLVITTTSKKIVYLPVSRLLKRGRRHIFFLSKPMLALPVRDLPTGDWIYEIKFDGYRALGIKTDKEVSLILRN